MRWAGSVAAALAILALPALADAPEAVSPWSARLTIYGWLPGVNADITGRNRDRSESESLSVNDLLQSLQFAAFATGEVRYERIGALVDFIYTDLSSTRTAPGRFGTEITGDIDTILATTALTYRAYEAERLDVDLLAGARVVYSGVRLKTQRDRPRGIERSVSTYETWVDPLFGARIGYAITDRWQATAMGNVGGFGIGSEFAWEAYGGVSYAFTKSIQGELGFRYLSIDYQSDRTKLDLQLYGPALGVTFRF